MGLQVRGTSVDGGTLIVKTRLSINMASLTLEQVAGKRKKLLADMVVQMAAEVRKDRTAEAAEEAARMVQTKLASLLEEKAEAFNQDVHFQKAVDHALKAKRSVELAAMLAAAGAKGGLEAAIMRVEPLQLNVVNLSLMALGEGGADVEFVVAWMRSNPSGLTRLEIDVPNTSAEVVAALHGLVAQTTTLVDLDVMEKGAPNLNVLQLNGTEHVKLMDLKDKKLGPVSAAVIAACIQRNRVLESLKCAAALPCRVFAFRPLTALSSRLCSHARSLDGNRLGPEGGAALAEGLKGNSTLQSLKYRLLGTRTSSKSVCFCVSARADKKANTLWLPTSLTSPAQPVRVLLIPLLCALVSQRWLQRHHGRRRRESGHGGARARQYDRLLRDPAPLLAREQHHGARPGGQGRW